jgi:isochorismate synthase
MIILEPRPAAEEYGELAARACEAAARRREPVLLSYAYDVDALDALSLYGRAIAARHVAAYWEQPADRRVLVAVGAATSVAPAGAHRFVDAAAAWGGLVDGAIAGDRHDLVALAGFAFAADGVRAPHWSEFSDGAMTVPELLYRCEGERARVTLSVMVQPGQTTSDVRFWAARLLEAPDEPRRSSAARTAQANTISPDVWVGAVTALSSEIAAGRVEKVVLAREVALRSEAAFDETAALARLRRGFPGTTVFAFHRGRASFIGATPERLVRVEGRRVRTMCLAGSARRGADERDDEAQGAGLLADAKERREHELVVRAITDALQPLCRQLDVPAEPVLMRMPNVQHLATPVEGTLDHDVSVLDLVERLHPTPALGGTPRAEALRLIHEHEPFDRGWYGGPVGWMDADGNGDFVVAIRSALIRGNEARLFAGCGIVAGSDPAREYEESSMKLRPMLWALDRS